jgi:hypothetical protein
LYTKKKEAKQVECGFYTQISEQKNSKNSKKKIAPGQTGEIDEETGRDPMKENSFVEMMRNKSPKADKRPLAEVLAEKEKEKEKEQGNGAGLAGAPLNGFKQSKSRSPLEIQTSDLIQKAEAVNLKIKMILIDENVK